MDPTLPLSMAWDAFGRKNGAATFPEFAAMIRNLTRDSTSFDPIIGCTVLTQPFFWSQSQWIDLTDSWSSQTVQGRYEDTREERGAQIWDAVISGTSIASHVAESPSRYGSPTLVRPRSGQGAFKVVVMDAYQRRCAITGESTLPVLEAAHILPFAEAGPHDVGNGMLLRSDFHKLFDRGLITVTPGLNVEVSPIIHEQWFNGRAYYRLHGRPLASLPVAEGDRPDARYLEWHNENRFQR